MIEKDPSFKPMKAGDGTEFCTKKEQEEAIEKNPKAAGYPSLLSRWEPGCPGSNGVLPGRSGVMVARGAGLEGCRGSHSQVSSMLKTGPCKIFSLFLKKLGPKSG